jgi:hypothetical protein
MGIRKIEDLLRSWAERGFERARPGLGQEIKNRIPHRLIAHRMDTVNIIVDLRISRVAAAAIITLALLIIGSFYNSQDDIGGRMLEDSKLLVDYTLHGGRAGKAQVLSSVAKFRDDLLAQGREVVYYGDKVNLDEPYALIMHWKISEDKYGVILADLSARTVGPKTLIRLQDHMLLSQRK